MINNNNFKKENNFFKTFIKAMLVFLLLTSCLYISSSVAKYLTSGNINNSATVSGFGKLNLIEYNNNIPTTLTESKTNNINIVPGVPLTKKVEINYLPDENSTVGSNIYLVVTVNNWEFDSNAKTFNISNSTVDLISFSINNNYTYLKTQNSNQYVFLVDELDVLESLNSLIVTNNEIYIYEKINQKDITDLNSKNISFSFEAYALQANKNLTPLEIWETK